MTEILTREELETLAHAYRFATPLADPRWPARDGVVAVDDSVNIDRGQLQRLLATAQAGIEQRTEVLDALEGIAPGACDTARDDGDVAYVCRIVADVVRDREEQIENLRAARGAGTQTAPDVTDEDVEQFMRAASANDATARPWAELRADPLYESAARDIRVGLVDFVSRRATPTGRRAVSGFDMEAADHDSERIDWLERQNAIVRGDSPILPPSCGFSVRQYIDQRITDEATPRTTPAGHGDAQKASAE